MFRKIALFACLVVGTAVFAESKVAGKARDAVDPDCTTQKAVKGAAMKATVGVGEFAPACPKRPKTSLA